MEEADFSDEVPRKLINRNDEVGELASSMDVMRQSVGKLITNVLNETENLKQVANNSSGILNKLWQEIDRVP